MRIFIADDDGGMRNVLRNIIESMDDMQCVGEASDGAEAVRLCIELKPDVVFLDVQMPVMDGIEASKEISAALPDIKKIFCTAHSQYMPNAFEVYAADYLLKPFKTDRVRQTLRRIQKAQIKEKITPSQALMIKNKDGMTFVPVSDVLLIYKEGRSSYIVTSSETYTTSDSLNDLWSKLEGSDFFKSHRAYIIRISAISKMNPYGRWTYIVSLKGTDKTALITYEKLKDLQDLMGI